MFSHTYRFIADTPGTHWYHGHLMNDRADGLLGGFVIKSPDETVPIVDGERVKPRREYHTILQVCKIEFNVLLNLIIFKKIAKILFFSLTKVQNKIIYLDNVTAIFKMKLSAKLVKAYASLSFEKTKLFFLFLQKLKYLLVEIPVQDWSTSPSSEQWLCHIHTTMKWVGWGFDDEAKEKCWAPKRTYDGSNVGGSIPLSAILVGDKGWHSQDDIMKRPSRIPLTTYRIYSGMRSVSPKLRHTFRCPFWSQCRLYGREYGTARTVPRRFREERHGQQPLVRCTVFRAVLRGTQDGTGGQSSGSSCLHPHRSDGYSENET